MTHAKSPWFAKPDRKNNDLKIAVIGAGIAGCCLAHRLQKEGHVVTLFDRNSAAGCEGSGNRIGLIKPRLDLDKRGFGTFNTQGYLFAVDYYDELERLGLPVWVGERGLFEMAEDIGDELRQKSLVDQKILSQDDMNLITQKDVSNRLGVHVPKGGLWYARSGCVEPVKLCQALSKSIKTEFGQDISSMERIGDQWLLKNNDSVVFKGDCVVLATAGETQKLNSFCDLHFEGRRGQVTYVRSCDETMPLRHAMSCSGYVMPTLFKHEDEICHLVGATFEKWSDFTDKSYLSLRDDSHEKNLVKFNRFFPQVDMDIIGGRVGMRAMTLDHLPMVGPIYSDEDYVEKYERLKHGPRAQVFEKASYVDGLYVMAGLGARGIQTAPLLAELLTSYISGTKSPVDEIVREALHPARFKIRSIKRAKP